MPDPDSVLDPTGILREELDELHERFAVLTDRVTSLENDRDTLLAAVEAQAEMNESAAAWHKRFGRMLRKARDRARARLVEDEPGAGEDPPETDLPDAPQQG